MTKEQAEYVVESINKLMDGKPCVSVSTGPSYKRNPEIRVNQIIKKAYMVVHDDGTATVGVSDTYGVMCGAQDWKFHPDNRSIHAHTKNGYDEPLSFSWALMDPASADWHEWHDVQRGMWKFPR